MTQPVRDDHIFKISRVIFGALVLVVFPFAWGMMLHPENSAQNFAWPIAPKISAMMFGSMYVSVLFLYTGVALARKWHHVALVLWATFPVLAGLGVVSLMHWDKFTDDPWRLGVWVTAYLVFPPVLIVLVALNRRRDPGTPDARDVHIPIGVRRLSLLFGSVFTLMALALIFAPVRMAELWPWPVKPLAAQAMGCLFFAPAIVQLLLLRESRWSAVRLVSAGAAVWFTAMLYSAWRCRDEFIATRALYWPFLGFLVVQYVLILWTHVHFERQRGRAVRGG